MKNYHGRKYEVFKDILDALPFGLVVLEYGRLRSASPGARNTDGWSTLEISKHEKVALLYSIDTDEKTRDVCQSLIPEEYSDKIFYSTTEHIVAEDSVDLLFLDADNNAEQCLALYQRALPYLKEDALILVDDVYGSSIYRKGDILVPLLENKGYKVLVYQPFALMIPVGGKYASTDVK